MVPETFVVPIHYPYNSMHCPTSWGGITLPPNPLQPGYPPPGNPNGYPFTVYGVGLYAAWAAGAIFTPLIFDNNNPSSVSWGFYNHGPVVLGTGGNQDQLTFYSSYTVTSGSTPNTSGILTITVTITSPPNQCAPGSWSNQQVTYSF